MVQHKRPDYVQIVTDRYGKQHLYFRHPRKPRKKLPGRCIPSRSGRLSQALDAKPVENGLKSEVPGSISTLIAQYYTSSSFTGLAAATKNVYRRQLEPFRANYGHLPVAQVKAKHIDQMLGTIVAKSTSQAHNMRKRLLKIMSLAVTWESRTDNPMLVVQKVKQRRRAGGRGPKTTLRSSAPIGRLARRSASSSKSCCTRASGGRTRCGSAAAPARQQARHRDQEERRHDQFDHVRSSSKSKLLSGQADSVGLRHRRCPLVGLTGPAVNAQY